MSELTTDQSMINTVFNNLQTDFPEEVKRWVTDNYRSIGEWHTMIKEDRIADTTEEILDSLRGVLTPKSVGIIETIKYHLLYNYMPLPSHAETNKSWQNLTERDPHDEI